MLNIVNFVGTANQQKQKSKHPLNSALWPRYLTKPSAEGTYVIKNQGIRSQMTRPWPLRLKMHFIYSVFIG